MNSMKKAGMNKTAILLCVLLLIGVLLVAAGIWMQKNRSQNSSQKRTASEKEIAAFLESAEHIESVSVKISYNEEGQITGAAVICPQASDPFVKAEIISILSAILNLRTNRIYVSSG